MTTTNIASITAKPLLNLQIIKYADNQIERDVNMKEITEISITKYNIGNLPKELRRTCFCCNKEMNNCNIVLLINHSAHIPNTLIHADCFAEWANKPEELCKDIESAYEDYKKLKAVFE